MITSLTAVYNIRIVFNLFKAFLNYTVCKLLTVDLKISLIFYVIYLNIFFFVNALMIDRYICFKKNLICYIELYLNLRVRMCKTVKVSRHFFKHIKSNTYTRFQLNCKFRNQSDMNMSMLYIYL